MLSLASILNLGPIKLISDYDGGCNYLYLGTLSRVVNATWPLAKETRAACIITSTKRLGELPPNSQFTVNCFVRGLVCAVDTKSWDRVQWITSRLPHGYTLYSDGLTSAILETGVVSAIDYAISNKEPLESARPMFRIAATKAVREGHHDAAKYLCTRFADSTLKQNVAVAAALEIDGSLVKWCIDTMHVFPTEAARALVYRGNIEALECLRSSGSDCLKCDQLVLYASLGGHVEAVDWVLNNTTNRFNQEEVCLMVCAKGLLCMLKHLVLNRGFSFNRQDCIRFAKNGSGVAGWIMMTQ